MSTLHLTADQPGERLDAFLARTQPQYSRSYWQKLCEQGRVVSNNRPLKSNAKLVASQLIAIALPEIPDFTTQTLPILYEDDDVVVINKPTGLLTHAKGAVSDEFTVAEFMRPRTTDGTDTNRPGIVHRLDRGTSGVIVAAKSPEAKHWLQKQFSLRKVKKTYTALVEGHLKELKARLELPIERNPKKPQTFRVGANGKPAITTYKTLEVYPDTTLLSLQPQTGRTHQLRVHLAHLGHPIVGDTLYGAKPATISHFFLHAASLELTLPSKERKTFTAPLPTELKKYLQKN